MDPKPLILAAIPRPKVRGKVTLGPVPGTLEFEEEQLNRRDGTAWLRTDIQHYCASCGRQTFGTQHSCPAEESPDTQPSGE